MRLGLDCSQHQLTWQALVERVQYAEANGFDGIWVFDHFKPLYADPDGPCLEGWTLLAALAALTKRVRLGTLVTGITHRPPSVLATEAVTIDHVSNGRLEIGLGAAWNMPEHEEFGLPFPPIKERSERLEEGIQVMKLLMTKDRANFKGKHYRLEDASYHPRPVQKPHPPIWIGATGEQLMLPIVGRLADAWHVGGSAEALKRKSKIVDEHARRAGRKPEDIVRASSLSLSEPWDRVRDRAKRLRELGFSHFEVSYPSEGQRRLDEFVEKVMPEIKAL
jgi:F420-dependent oxidoreductase-like protein